MTAPPASQPPTLPQRSGIRGYRTVDDLLGKVRVITFEAGQDPVSGGIVWWGRN